MLPNNDIERLVPEVYRDSRDFKIFLKLLDIIISESKYDINNWIKLLDPDFCPDDFLPLIGDYVGYRYSSKFTYTETRTILKNFVELIKNRGSEIGFREAISILVNAKFAEDPTNVDYRDAVNQLELLDVYYDYDLGRTSIYFTKPINYNREFLDYIRPVGTYLDLIVSDFPEPETNIAISTKVDTIKRPYRPFISRNNILNISTAELLEKIDISKYYLIPYDFDSNPTRFPEDLDLDTILSTYVFDSKAEAQEFARSKNYLYKDEELNKSYYFILVKFPFFGQDIMLDDPTYKVNTSEVSISQIGIDKDISSIIDRFETSSESHTLNTLDTYSFSFKLNHSNLKSGYFYLVLTINNIIKYIAYDDSGNIKIDVKNKNTNETYVIGSVDYINGSVELRLSEFLSEKPKDKVEVKAIYLYNNK